MWIASEGHPSFTIVLIFVLGTVLMRSAGCVINDYADQNFDKHVKRTQDRPLAAGKVSSFEALGLAVVLALLALLLILPLNQLTLLLSIPAVFLAVSYPFMKRFFVIPQAYLGIAFGFGIPMVFATILDSVPPIAWWLLLANIFWCIAYDTEYAMVDRDDDLPLGIYSSAIFFGRWDVLAVMSCYGFALLLLVKVGLIAKLGGFYFAGLVVAAGIAFYHYRLIMNRSREGCFKAFLHNNWFGAAVFAGMVFDKWFGWCLTSIK